LGSRLNRHLIFGPVVPDVQHVTASLLAAPEAPLDLTIDFLAAPREHAVYLLHVGAEIEQALMVQYLFAAYSLGGPQIEDPANREKAHRWRQTIASIAQQEMGHLVTVENLLQLIGGPLTFERQDFPAPSDLYPFEFTLQPLTRRSLAEYVLAEMPDEQVIHRLKLTDQIEEVKKAAGGDMGATKVNRVGVLYNALTRLFTVPGQGKEPVQREPHYIAQADIQAGSIAYQARASEWGLGYRDTLVLTATDRPGALANLTAISEQGEGSTIGNLPESHFGRFLAIFNEFPKHGEWTPARAVAENPSTQQGERLSLITNHEARTWAKLANLRYRMVLMYLLHAFHTQAPEAPGARNPRGLLISWAFGEMYNVRSLADILMSMPLEESPDGRFAGPPFELPYTLSLADREPDRWRLHRDLLAASQKYVNLLLESAHPSHREYLLGLASADQRALQQTEPLIGA
jgi:hypothetical protein